MPVENTTNADRFCFCKARWDGSVASLFRQFRRLHHHPNHHTKAELKLVTLCSDLNDVCRIFYTDADAKENFS